MKKRNLIFSFLCMLTVMITACSSDDLTIDEMTLSKSEQKAIVKFISTNLMIQKGDPVSITSVKLEKINNNYYLLCQHDNNVTAALLRVENKSILKYGNISCTSELQSNNIGSCIPHENGKYCISLSSGNCTKTVTSNY